MTTLCVVIVKVKLLRTSGHFSVVFRISTSFISMVTPCSYLVLVLVLVLMLFFPLLFFPYIYKCDARQAGSKT